MLLLEEIGVEAAMIIATVAALAVLRVGGRAMLVRGASARIQAERTREMRTIVQRTRRPERRGRVSRADPIRSL